MSRKIQRLVWRDGQRRRSPRISALHVWKGQQKSSPLSSQSCSHARGTEGPGDSKNNHQGPPSRTRSRIKRKLHQMGVKSPNYEDRSTKGDQSLITSAKASVTDDSAPQTDQPSITSPVPFMPSKRILEHVLDILQRRDTYEIFAEPVDPKEVEDYYEIIKEPMDFGTMRAKLHEEMYENLEQFEHDVFLIPKNAMHFNSTGTIYFRQSNISQARSIYELAKKVFHVLKNDPENFEMEFSGTRRRSGRRLQDEGKCLDFNSSPRVATNNVRSSSMTTSVSSKATPCSLSSPSSLRRSIRRNTGFSIKATSEDSRDYDFSSGARDSRSNFVEVDRRCTYTPWISFCKVNDSIVSTIYSDPNPLARVNQGDISYEESLMLFAKDLGPTAQMVAKRKLQGWWKDAPNIQTLPSKSSGQSATCQVPTAFASAWDASGNLDRVMANASRDSHNYSLSKSCSVPNTTSRITNLTNTRKGAKIFSIFDRDKVIEKQAGNVQPGSDYSTFGAEDLNSPITRVNETSKKPFASNLEWGKMDNKVPQPISVFGHSQSKHSEFKLHENNKLISSSRPWHTAGITSLDRTNGFMPGTGSSSRAGHAVEPNQLAPLASRFAFDLPFLKSRLGQMNSLGQDGLLQPRFQQVSVKEGPSPGQMGVKMRTFGSTHQAGPSGRALFSNDNPRSSALDTNLSLRFRKISG